MFISSIFSDISTHMHSSYYLETRVLLTPLNEDVNRLNDKCLTLFPGEEVTYYSFDSVNDDRYNLYPQEFLNSLSPANLPPHKLTLKKGVPVMLLRNLNPTTGLCNGSRLLCRQFTRNIIEAEILTGEHKGHTVFLPRMPLKNPEDSKMPFELTRKQFPIRLSFALTINKSQGQTVHKVGIYLTSHVFTHGQLYVALSRGMSSSATTLLIKRGSVTGHDGMHTKNVVFKELLIQPHLQVYTKSSLTFHLAVYIHYALHVQFSHLLQNI
ncbi:hypothetical protein KSP39_PZI015626 [Platanthera zijinensis]|uniref:DNA helicase Pif1-like 2B domain-containing protein n=1 Tax=Platanthera zijinensis TaxID=2320716 RepID=A0AAP0B833_9ASPA